MGGCTTEYETWSGFASSLSMQWSHTRLASTVAVGKQLCQLACSVRKAASYAVWMVLLWSVGPLQQRTHVCDCTDGPWMLLQLRVGPSWHTCVCAVVHILCRCTCRAPQWEVTTSSLTVVQWCRALQQSTHLQMLRSHRLVPAWQCS